MTLEYKEVSRVLRESGDKEIAAHSKRFFKTGEGEYGEGDRFLGVRVPRLRKVAGQFRKLPLGEVEKLLHSEYHEERLTAIFIQVRQFREGSETRRRSVYELFVANRNRINNWDLVDSSAPNILGPFLENRERGLLYELARSERVWDRRIAIMSCFHFIRNGDFRDTLALAELLIDDDHDLVQKAVGWMLREIGNRDLKSEERFLNRFSKRMPRTMLRYAIEKFPEELRKRYLA